jgi:hypothetical protein
VLLGVDLLHLTEPAAGLPCHGDNAGRFDGRWLCLPLSLDNRLIDSGPTLASAPWP